MRGTLINIAAVAAGTTAGVLAGSRLPEPVRIGVLRALGLFTLVLGVSGALRTFERGRVQDAIVVLVGLVLGTVAGTVIDIEGRIQALGERLRRRTGSGGAGFAAGFLTASVVFCVGPLTVLGSLRDGLSGDYSLLAIKSVLDGFASLALAAVYGIGVGASVLTILVYQGGLTLGAGLVRDVFTPEVLRALDAAGGVIILGVGLRLLEVSDVKPGNMLPALVFVPVGAAVLW